MTRFGSNWVKGENLGPSVGSWMKLVAIAIFLGDLRGC